MMCKDCIHAGSGRRSRLTIASHHGIGKVANACALALMAGVIAAGNGLARAEAPSIAPQGAESPVSLQLWPTAVVTNDRVMLDDVARISEGDRAFMETLRTCEVAAAPPAGSSTVITLQDVTAALSKAGINRARVMLRGSSRCQIMRPGEVPSTRPVAAERGGGATFAVERSPGSTASVKTGGRADVDATEAGTLRAALRQYLTARVANLDGTPEIRFSPAVQRALGLSSPTYQFRIRQKGNEVLGLVALEVDVIEGGRVADTVPVVVEVTLAKKVVVARSAINRGEIIAPRHLMLAERRFSRPSDIGVSDLQSLIGQETCRYIENGSMLVARDVRARPLVKRGDTVTVWVRQGALVIKSVGKALEAGAYGEGIAVKNEATGETFAATVTGPQTAEVRRKDFSPAFSLEANESAPGSAGAVASAGGNGQ